MTTDRFTLCSMRAADGGARLLLVIRVESECGERDEALTVFTARLSATPRLGALTEEQYAFFAREAEMTKAMDAGLRFLAAGADGDRGEDGEGIGLIPIQLAAHTHKGALTYHQVW